MCLSVAMLCGLAVECVAIDTATPEVQRFLKSGTEHKGFEPGRAEAALLNAKFQQSIIDAIKRPAEAKPWSAYRRIFLTPERIDAGRAYLAAHPAEFTAAAERHGVAPAMAAAIIGVETFYGRNAGKYRVLDALATLAFRHPPRAEFFQRELIEYLILTQEQGFRPEDLKGSYAGAMGLGQFMPSSYRAYATDADADGQADIWNNPADAIDSVANYFARHGWRSGEPVAVPVSAPPDWIWKAPRDYKPDRVVADLRAQGFAVPEWLKGDERVALVGLDGADGREYWLGFQNFYVITRYNRSPLYAMAVLQLAEALGFPVTR